MSVFPNVRPAFLRSGDGVDGFVRLVEIRPTFKQRHRESRINFEYRKRAGVDFDYKYIFRLMVNLTYARKSDRFLMLSDRHISSVGRLILEDKSLGRYKGLYEIFECSVSSYVEVPTQSLGILSDYIAQSLGRHFKSVMDTRHCRPD